MIPIEKRITSKIEMGPECWRWLGFHDKDGYGRFSWSPTRQQGAHRVVYEFFKEPIPEGMVPDHLCRNRWCVNPDHMEIVTPQENSRRQVHSNSLKTHCKRGHEFTEENTIRGKNNSRKCRTCHNESRRKTTVS